MGANIAVPSIYKEVHVLGELLRKYREKYLDKPLATAQEKESLYRENFYQQIESVKNELLSKSTEAEAFKSRNMELEECQLRQEDAINAMKRQTKKICVSYNFFFQILGSLLGLIHIILLDKHMDST